MSKKLIIVLSIVVMVFILIFGIVVKIYMDKKAEYQAQQEQLKKNLVESKAEITELLEWNYKDIRSITFEYDGGAGSGVIRVPFDKSLSTTPAGNIWINGWVNENKALGFSADLDPETLKVDGNYGGYPMLENSLYKNPHPITQGDIQSAANYYLTLEDISSLKKQGFTKDIAFEQIKKYFEEKVE